MRQQLRLRFDSKEEAVSLLRAPRRTLSGDRKCAAEKADHVLRGQFFHQAPRRLDPLTLA